MFRQCLVFTSNTYRKLTFFCTMVCLTYLTVSFCCLHYAFANITHLIIKKQYQNSIIKCAIEIANENFNLRKLTVVLTLQVEDESIDSFLKAYKGTVTVGTKTGGPTVGQVVVIVDSYKSFKKIQFKLKPDLKGETLLSSGVKIMILLLSNPEKIERITKFLWSYHATNAIIIESDKNTVNIYTYFPYKNHLNCLNTDSTLLEAWKGKSLKKNLYPDKMANMHGCPLYISTNKLYHQTTEQKIPLQLMKKTMVRLLREKMNFTPILSTRDYVSIDSDRAKNWSDSLTDVISGLANISTCSIPLGIDRLGLLDYTVPYFRVRLAWFAPPVTTGPVLWRLLSPLNGYLWLILLLIIFCVTSLPFTLKLTAVKRFCYRHFRNIDKLQGVAIRTWGVLLGQPIRVAPRRFRDFYIISLWMWFTFVVRSAYQSVLIGALKTETIVGDFGDLRETIDKGYRYGGRAGILAHFEHDPLIRKGFEIIPEDKFEQTFRNVIEGKQKFVLATSLEYALTYCLVQGKKDDECGHILPDSIMTVPLVVWMKMCSPFMRPLAVWLPRLIESGLLVTDSVKKQISSFTMKTTDPTPLTRHQVLSCLLCLLLGYTISIGVFALETLRYKTMKFKNRLVQKSCHRNVTIQQQ